MITPDRLNCINAIQGSEYRGHVIDVDLVPDKPVEFVTRILPDIEVREATIEKVFNKIDASIRREEEKVRAKVGEPCMVLHKGEWKEGKITTAGVDGSVRVQLGKGGISLTLEEFNERIVAHTDENKDALEKLIEYEELRKEADNDIQKLKDSLKKLDLRPFLQPLEEEIEAAAKADREKVEKMEKKVAREEKKAAKLQKAAPSKKLVFVRKK
jgi:hypothetical protein